jgi:hypothetical protein
MLQSSVAAFASALAELSFRHVETRGLRCGSHLLHAATCQQHATATKVK